MQPSIQCLTCGADFWTLDEYTRHRRSTHTSEPDRGTAFHTTGRRRLSSLISDAECPEPPRLDG